MSDQDFTEWRKNWDAAIVRLQPLSERLSVTKMKVNKSFSRETMCFTATIMLDGKAVATAENDGNGGCTFVQWNSRDIRESVMDDFDRLNGRPLTLDCLIDHVVEQEQGKKDWKRFADSHTKKGRTAFILTDDDGSEYKGWVASRDPVVVRSALAKYAQEGKRVKCIA